MQLALVTADVTLLCGLQKLLMQVYSRNVLVLVCSCNHACASLLVQLDLRNWHQFFPEEPFAISRKSGAKPFGQKDEAPHRHVEMPINPRVKSTGLLALDFLDASGPGSDWHTSSGAGQGPKRSHPPRVWAFQLAKYLARRQDPINILSKRSRERYAAGGHFLTAQRGPESFQERITKYNVNY